MLQSIDACAGPPSQQVLRASEGAERTVNNARAGEAAGREGDAALMGRAAGGVGLTDADAVRVDLRTG